MSGAGDYIRYRKLYQDVSGQVNILAATDDQTLVTCKSASHTLFIQRIVVDITTYSAKTWLFKDSTSTPVPIAALSIPAAAVALPSESNSIVFDFGPEGVQLTEGKNFLLDVSAVGAAAMVKWQGYQKFGVTTPASSYAGAALQ